jgi:tetratricopeptide (TPR) repeat protein
LGQGNIAEAKTFINKSLDIFTGFVTGWDIVQSLVFLGEVTLAEGNLAEAARIFRNALDQALESHSFPLAMDALLGLAQVKADAGQAERACELASYIADHAASIQPTKDRAGQLCQRLLPHCTSQKIADSRLPLSATPAEIAQYFLT